jgi:hypothetical protein
MKKFLIFLLLAVTVTFCATASTAPRVSRATLAAMEKSLDNRINGLWSDNPFLLLGTTRGVYLDGYGAVFTAEVELMVSPLSMMHPVMSKEEIVRYHQKKLERVPTLKKALREAIVSTAASLDTVPPDEEIVMVIFLARHQWEDTTNVPVQIKIEGKKKALLDAQHAGGAGLDQVIHITEY